MLLLESPLHHAHNDADQPAADYPDGYRPKQLEAELSYDYGDVVYYPVDVH